MSEIEIESWNCKECELRELDWWEKETHEELTNHILEPRYV